MPVVDVGVQSNGAGSVQAPYVDPAELAAAKAQMTATEVQGRKDAMMAELAASVAAHQVAKAPYARGVPLLGQPTYVQPEALRLATDSKARKDTPVFSGVLRYFPDALGEVAKLSMIGNDKHNPGQPLHWSKGKSNDHGDCLVRHQMEFDQIDPETITARYPQGLLHATHVAWRALAQLQTLLENKT